jgi:hypothetical protein
LAGFSIVSARIGAGALLWRNCTGFWIVKVLLAALGPAALAATYLAAAG